jgi:hypothetical protein
MKAAKELVILHASSQMARGKSLESNPLSKGKQQRVATPVLISRKLLAPAFAQLKPADAVCSGGIKLETHRTTQ